jgi:hypothetical protein
MLEAIPNSSIPTIFPTSSQLTAADRWDHFLTRLGYKRGEHRITPGLYAIGSPTPESPVFVSANYTLSFDALRSALAGVDGYILVLNTRGINVWCAAGKGTFGTGEIVRRVDATQLKEVVSHRKLILPQLGAPGVAAHEVKQRTGFMVEYGPVRAADLPEYLKTHQATEEMRLVHFPLRDRVVLIPVDITQTILPALLAAVVLYFIGGILYSLAAITILLAGVVLFPVLLPWLPTPNFSTKGFILGGLAALPFALSSLFLHQDWGWYRQVGQALGFLLAMPAAIAFISLNFTGSTPFTSRSGVRKEIFTYIRAMAWMASIGTILMIVFAFVH